PFHSDIILPTVTCKIHPLSRLCQWFRPPCIYKWRSSPFTSHTSIMTAIFISRVYQRSFEARPNITLAVTGGLLNALGDAVAQASQSIVRYGSGDLMQTDLLFQYRRHDKPQNYDIIRTLRFFCFGFTICMSFLGP